MLAVPTKKKDDQEQQEQKKTKQMHGFKKQRLMAAEGKMTCPYTY
jgi:hypothetical protein